MTEDVNFFGVNLLKGNFTGRRIIREQGITSVSIIDRHNVCARSQYSNTTTRLRIDNISIGHHGNGSTAREVRARTFATAEQNTASGDTSSTVEFNVAGRIIADGDKGTRSQADNARDAGNTSACSNIECNAVVVALNGVGDAANLKAAGAVRRDLLQLRGRRYFCAVIHAGDINPTTGQSNLDRRISRNFNSAIIDATVGAAGDMDTILEIARPS